MMMDPIPNIARVAIATKFTLFHTLTDQMASNKRRKTLERNRVDCGCLVYIYIYLSKAGQEQYFPFKRNFN